MIVNVKVPNSMSKEHLANLVNQSAKLVVMLISVILVYLILIDQV